MKKNYYKLGFLFFALIVFTQTGCGANDDQWNEYFRIFQEGSKISGVVVDKAATDGAIEFQIGFQINGQKGVFKESWPEAKDPGFKNGDRVEFYALESSPSIKYVTLSMLKEKGIA